jgi:hypothetical protein
VAEVTHDGGDLDRPRICHSPAALVRLTRNRSRWRLVAAGHLCTGVPELLLHVALIGLGGCGEAGAQPAA